MQLENNKDRLYVRGIKMVPLVLPVPIHGNRFNSEGKNKEMGVNMRK